MNRLCLLVFCVIGGCSYPPQTIDTSGPHPTLGETGPMTPKAKDAEVTTGRLVVMTPSIPEVTQYSGYTVYTADGHLVAHEDNQGARPAERKLAPGRYFVRLDERVPGRDFWVTVERGQVTRVENPSWGGAPPAVR
jgi:hypothetical protein